jgi:hypothetical protein
LKDEEFENTKTALIEDHQASLEHFRIMIEKERQQINSKHAEEIEDYKSEMAKITEELNGKIADAEKNLQDLIVTHNSNIEKLTADKDALIAAAEESKAKRETELQSEIDALHEAHEKSLSQIMVLPLIILLTVANARGCK